MISMPGTTDGVLPAPEKLEDFPASRSFRDPDGFTFSLDRHFLRAVRRDAYHSLTEFLATPLARSWIEEGRFIQTATDFPETSSGLLSLASAIEGHHVVEHERIPFPSYPEEWAPEMLHAAGRLTLDLAQEALAEGFGLKDATPYNVLFRGPKPVLVDVLSVERRDPTDVVWRAYAQFVRTFLLPLAADRARLRTTHQAFTTSREGIEPDELFTSLSFWQKISRTWFGLVSLPVWLSGRETASLYRQRNLDDPEAARFILRRLLTSLQHKLARLAPRENRPSPWSGYLVSASPYRPEHLDAKMLFVQAALQEAAPSRVLDVGCNTGKFSELAARCGTVNEVVAIDSDAVAVGALWRRAVAGSLNILPLVVDFARPTPATGWKNQETTAFLDRAHGHFDAVMFLAVLHHLLISSRIPLNEILTLAAGLTTKWLIVEWVEPEDAMFQRLVRGRDSLYGHLTSSFFETCAQEHFVIARRHPIAGAHRVLYLLRKRA